MTIDEAGRDVFGELYHPHGESCSLEEEFGPGQCLVCWWRALVTEPAE